MRLRNIIYWSRVKKLFTTILILSIAGHVLGKSTDYNFQNDQIKSDSIIIKSEFIFNYAPFKSVHASTIAETRDGFLAAWFGGSYEGASDVRIWTARRLGNQWSVPFEAADGIQSDSAAYPCWNPVLYRMPDSSLQLFYKVGPNPREWWGMVKRTDDEGISWSEARRLPDGFLGPIKNKPVTLESGAVIFPSSTELSDERYTWRVHFEMTQDTGKTWYKTFPDSQNNNQIIDVIQPTTLKHPDHTLQALIRSKYPNIYESWSADCGKTWSALSPTVLPHPNSGIDAVTLKDGRHALVYNHTAEGRTPLNLSISKDGKTWEAAMVLESEPGEYSYPAIIQSSDGLLHITYTWKRERIKYVIIDPEKIKTMPMTKGQWPPDIK